MFVRCLLIQTWLLSVAGQLTNRQGFRMTDRLTDTGSPSSDQQYFGAPSGQRISSLYPEYSLRQQPSLQRQEQSQSGAPVLRLSRGQFVDNGQPTRELSPVQSRQQGADRSSGTNQRSFSNLQLARIDPSGRIIPLSPAEREEFIRKGGKLIGPISRQSQSSDRSAQRPSVQSRPSTAANNRMTNSNNFMGFNRASNVYDNFLYPSVDQRRTPSSFIQNPYPRDSSWRSPQTARDRDNALRREWVEQQDVLERQRISQKKEEELQKALNLQREIDLKNSLQEKNQPATSDLTGADLPATSESFVVVVVDHWRESPQLLYTTTPPPVETSTPAAEQTSTVAISAPSAVISAPSAVVAAPSAGGTDQPNQANPVIQANPVSTAVESKKVESSTTSQPTKTTQTTPSPNNETVVRTGIPAKINVSFVLGMTNSQVVTTEAPVNSIKVVIPGSMTTDSAYSANNSSRSSISSSSSIQRADAVTGVSADTNTWTQTTASVSTPLPGTGVITNGSKADPAVTATSGYEAKVNELIRQMAIDMLLSRIKQSQVQTSPAGFDSQLAAELIRLLGGGNVTVAPTLVLPSSSSSSPSQGPALQVPTTTTTSKAVVDTTETTTGAAPVTPPALTSGNALYTPPEKKVTVVQGLSRDVDLWGVT
ncbi:hypothetical protein Btru_055369 [Bulinus truncatus]|nr:hypothetical protein Btru_055369 [Bulinus truncatus]